MLDYRGSYIIILTKEADIKDVPSRGTVIAGQKITVISGRVREGVVGIQFYSSNDPFCWVFSSIKEIYDSDGKVIWKNTEYKKME